MVRLLLVLMTTVLSAIAANAAASMSFAESVRRGIETQAAKRQDYTPPLQTVVALSAMSENPKERVAVADVVFAEARSVFFVSSAVDAFNLLLVDYTYVEEIGYSSGVRTSKVSIPPRAVSGSLLSDLRALQVELLADLPDPYDPVAIGTYGAAPHLTSGVQPAASSRTGIYAIRLMGEPRALRDFIGKTDSTAYLVRPDRLGGADAIRYSRIAANRNSAKPRSVPVPAINGPCDIPRSQEPPNEDRRSKGAVAFDNPNCPTPGPIDPHPSPEPEVWFEAELIDDSGSIVQDLNKPLESNPPLVGSIERIFMCGIDPATGQPFSILPDYRPGGPTEPEGNCPADVTWAPEPEFNLSASNGLSGRITVIRLEGVLPGEPDDLSMRVRLTSTLKWGTFVWDQPVFDEDVNNPQFIPRVVNTLAFKPTLPLCVPAVTGVEAPCGGFFPQTGVIGLLSPSYEDEVQFPNDRCDRNLDGSGANDYCLEKSLAYTSSLPCMYEDTPFSDDYLVPTVGSGCPEDILNGTEYFSTFNLRSPDNADLTFETKEVVHSGQIGERSFLGPLFGFAVFAVDARKLEEKLAERL